MTPISTLKIQPATGFRSQIWTASPGLLAEKHGLSKFSVSRLRFTVPLRYDDPDGETLQLAGCIVFGDSETAWTNAQLDWDAHLRPDNALPGGQIPLKDRPIMVYLCGGPGADNPWYRVPDMSRWLLRKGFQILYLDYRGCGGSEPVSCESLKSKGLETDQQIADYLKLFGQDNIVRDLEAVRLCLSARLKQAGRDSAKGDQWSVLGQSYGGYIGLTYMSLHPEGLRDVFITGGLPPCGMPLDDYFKVKHGKLVKETLNFYAKYPEDKQNVRDILALISEIGPKSIKMTGRGYLSAQKLLTLGRQFGSQTGFEEVHGMLSTIKSELTSMGKLGPKTIRAFERTLHIDERPLYALLLEQTWCSGNATRWSGERIWRDLPGYEYLQRGQNGEYLDPSTFPDSQLICFTSHVYGKFMYDTHEELVDLKGVSEILAEHDWDCPYDYKKLACNQVPVYAVSFASDMHLDIDVARDTAAKVGNMHFVIDEVHWHQALRHRPAEILEGLFDMREAVMNASRGDQFAKGQGASHSVC